MTPEKAGQGTLEQILADVVATGDLSLYGIAADWLDEHGRGAEAELVRLSWLERRPEVEDRIQRLLASGVKPCVPRMVNGIGMELAWVPPGVFLMGSPHAEQDRRDDEDQHEVVIARGFWLGVHPVTQGQWQAIMGSNPSAFSPAGAESYKVRGIPGKERRRLPVECVSWDDAQAFLRNLNEKEGNRNASYRLPREEEWEYGCRAGASCYQTFHFGNGLGSRQASFNGGAPYGGALAGPCLGRTSAAGSYPPSAWGLHDMHGNVWEWCQSWYAEGSTRVIRGGSWYGPGWFCRSAMRYGEEPHALSCHIGFRAALSPSPDQ